MSTGIGESYRLVAQRVAAAATKAGRGPDAVRLVAVSKRKPAGAVLEAFEAGARDFGESYVQELQDKKREVSRLLGDRAGEIRWHFIGGLQSRKVASLPAVSLIHSVCRSSQLDRLDRLDRGSDVLIQVNVSGESSKDGVAPADVLRFCDTAMAKTQIRVRGLMTMPAPLSIVGAEGVLAGFRKLRELRQQCVAQLGTRAADMVELSMGMSDDYELAIAEGATLIRVGTAIFGARS